MRVAPVGVVIAAGMVLEFAYGCVLMLDAAIEDHRAFVRTIMLLILALQLVGLLLWVLAKRNKRGHPSSTRRTERART